MFREGLALVLQALIEAEAAQQIGAGRYERSATRTTHRNGSRTRLLSTKALPGRLTRSARQRLLHLPTDWPWAQQFLYALARLRAVPRPG